MKTEQLIAALAADRQVAGRPLLKRLGLAIALGALPSLAIFLACFGPRVDLTAALGTWRFDLKIALMGLTVLLALGFCRALAMPVRASRAGRRLLLSLAVLAAALVIELIMVPSDAWKTRLVGTNSMICLTAIPLFSIAPLAAILTVLRSGAPTSPALAGAGAGFLAAACGATLYAFHCFDDSPLFVATWYILAAAIVVVLGTLVGHRLLRW